jgi:hypothetical protein
VPSGMTTVNEPLAITHNIYQSLDSGKDVSVILLRILYLTSLASIKNSKVPKIEP